MEPSVPPPVDYTATLPRKRVAAGALFVDAAGRALLVEPAYKATWDFPGGNVEADESPRAACRREVAEELALDREPGRLLAVDWVPPQAGRTEGLMVVFDGGELDPATVAAIRVPPDELRGFAFLDPAAAAGVLDPRLHRRLLAALRARSEGVALYLEHGHIQDVRPTH